LKKLAVTVLAPVALLALAFWIMTLPGGRLEDDLPSHIADLKNGADLFHAGACASCHAEPDSDDDGPLLLGGGRELPTEFGLFRVPNISPDTETGIGGWSDIDFVNAMQVGVSPDGRHYYPAFPYPSYSRMSLEDVLDLKAFIDTLPPVAHVVGPHELGFPWNLRRGVGLWKKRYLDSTPVIAVDQQDDLLLRGRYLVEGVAHCGECHTPRDRFGGLDRNRWLSGAPNPDGEGNIPNITPHDDGLSDWSQKDLAYYFRSGLTPDFDTSGGSMVEVQENLARLSDFDREAIAAYLKAIPARPDMGN
jgi:mono/diheme cytochrome c family protein